MGAGKFDGSVVWSFDAGGCWGLRYWSRWMSEATRTAGRFDVAEKLKLGFRDEGASKLDAAVIRSLDSVESWRFRS